MMYLRTRTKLAEKLTEVYPRSEDIRILASKAGIPEGDYRDGAAKHMWASVLALADKAGTMPLLIDEVLRDNPNVEIRKAILEVLIARPIFSLPPRPWLNMAVEITLGFILGFAASWRLMPPTPTEPVAVPTHPVLTQPVPTQSVPTQSVPTQPVPTQPVPTRTRPVVTQPVPTQPAPVPTQPDAGDLTMSVTVNGTPSDGGALEVWLEDPNTGKQRACRKGESNKFSCQFPPRAQWNIHTNRGNGRCGLTRDEDLDVKCPP
jgi:hypothetical protein